MTDRSRRPQRPLHLLFVILVFTLSLASAWGFGAQRSNPSEPDPQLQVEQTQAVLQADDETTQNNPAGDLSFREASALLQIIKPPPRRLARFTKPRGVLGSLSYYGKETFKLLFTNGPPKVNSDSDIEHKLSAPLTKAVKLLEESAAMQNEDAIYKLAELNFYGTHTHPKNYKVAFERYKELADLSGNSTAQHMVGFIYATGIGGAVEKDQAKALLYQSFAADAGNVRAQMTVAYRHHSGIAAPRNCEKAVHYYKQVADKAMAFVRTGPPGGQQIAKGAYRISEDDGGIYGEGASVSSSGHNAKQGGTNTNEGGTLDNMLLYLDLMARRGDLKATFSLARVHYEGSRALQRDFRIAREKFLDVARRYWTKDGKIRQDVEHGVAKIASQAAGYLGRMFLRGEGVEQNFHKARIWFQRGIENGDILCQYSLGLMYLHGLGMDKNPVRAADYFGAAADQDFANAQVRLGVLFMDQGNLDTATKYFELAARNGHIEAFYYLAEMANLGVGAGQDRNCNQAALYYKIVAEKAEPIHSDFQEANDAYEDQDIATALPLYMQAAEQGYEAAQANVAYLLDRASGVSRSRFARFIAQLPSRLSPWRGASSGAAADRARTLLGDAALALIYWTRSAKQANIDSLVKMGDYYLLGLGTAAPAAAAAAGPSSEWEWTGPPDPAKAVACYTAAAETQQSAQALWNLGWMHENGAGVAQDFHLAKRFYDQCGETNREARAPVAAALLKLRLRSAWNWLVGGAVHGIDDGPARQKHYSLSGWISDFLKADLEDRPAGATQPPRDADEWGEDPARHGAASDDALYGDEYYGDGVGDDDGLLEMAFIVALAGTLAVLLWYRQTLALRDQRRQREQQPQPQQQPPQPAPADEQRRDRGLFPAPGDPEYPGWVAGGVGH